MISQVIFNILILIPNSSFFKTDTRNCNIPLLPNLALIFRRPKHVYFISILKRIKKRQGDAQTHDLPNIENFPDFFTLIHILIFISAKARGDIFKLNNKHYQIITQNHILSIVYDIVVFLIKCKSSHLDSSHLCDRYHKHTREKFLAFRHFHIYGRFAKLLAYNKSFYCSTVNNALQYEE